VHGQYLDISFEERSDVSRAEYITMAEGKTAAMFAAAFAIGAIVAEAPPRVVEALGGYGRHTGLAFQLVDDVLGIWGDPAITGKPVGDDLATRKMTYPVIAALDAGGDESAELASAYARPPSPDEDVAPLATLIEATGARAATEETARAEERAALDTLDAAGLGDEAQSLLAEYAAAAIGRVA
jgi:geranylgeranyl diphosphate synthase type I